MSIQITAPDGTLQTSLIFSTTSTSRFITGVISSGTADVQVSIRGSAYTSDPSLVAFTGTTFIVPNPTSYPNGLTLISGENDIGVQDIPLVGPSGPPATATIFLISGDTEGASFPPPTGIVIERQDQAVLITVQEVTDSRVTGYNFYASTDAGGGLQGYTLLNVFPVTTANQVQNSVPLYTLVSNNPAQTPPSSSPTLMLRAKIDQEDLAGTVLATNVDAVVEIPSDVTTIGTTITLTSLTTTNYYQFLHNRLYDETSDPQTVFVGQFASLDPATPLYYVTTAIYYDPASQTEYESFFSVEVVGMPVNTRLSVATLPVVTRQQIIQDAITSIYRQDSDQAIQPAAVVRDTVLDPFSTETSRVRFILDFFYRAMSFTTLLQIDDPNGTGTSLAPTSSAYKTALATAFFLADPNDIQPVIDGAFDKLASNFGVARPAGKRSIGEVRFYTSTPPTISPPFPLGTLLSGSGVSFRTTAAGSMSVNSLASYYNPTTRQYSVTVPVMATAAGSNGNLGAGQITVGAPYGFQVTNDAPTYGGTDTATNTQLAALALGTLSSVDTGTTQGYQTVAANTPGVIQAVVVRSGDALMQRDIDPTTNQHVGGKVDIWTQGFNGAFVSDTFALTFVRKRDVQFVVLGDPALYQFQALDPALTPTNPISSMLNYPSLGLGLRDITTGMEFDLTNVTYVNYNTIQLSLGSGVVQPPVTLTDVVLGDYQYTAGTKFVFSRQPVNYVATVTGTVSGILGQNNYSLIHPNGPLNAGRSTNAGDYLQIVQTTSNGVTVPSGAISSVSNEPHILTGQYVTNVDTLGADLLSVVVTDPTGFIIYAGPLDPSGFPDYEIVDGTQTTPLGINRTSTSTIPDGGSVLISYSTVENFTVQYQINLIPSAVQLAVNTSEHSTADVLAKDAFQTPVDITATVVLQSGYPQSSADPAIRANLQYLVSNLRMGTPLRRSDVIATIGNTPGVSYVVVPLTLMARGVNSSVAMDNLNTSSLGDLHLVPAWSSTSVTVWLITQELTSPTVIGGGTTGVYVGVFQDDIALSLDSTNPTNLTYAAGRTFIIGNDGYVIPGYSDDATLAAAGYIASAIPAARQALTQNRIMVSLPVGDSPGNHSYWATYQVGSESGDQDIVTTSVEYIVLGIVTLSYTQDLG